MDKLRRNAHIWAETSDFSSWIKIFRVRPDISLCPEREHTLHWAKNLVFDQLSSSEKSSSAKISYNLSSVNGGSTPQIM